MELAEAIKVETAKCLEIVKQSQHKYLPENSRNALINLYIQKAEQQRLDSQTITTYFKQLMVRMVNKVQATLIFPIDETHGNGLEELRKNLLTAIHAAQNNQLDFEHSELVRSLYNQNPESFSASDLFWLELHGGLEVKSTLTEFTTINALHETYLNLVEKIDLFVGLNSVVENSLIAYAIQDDNPRGVWYSKKIFLSDEMKFLDWLEPFPIKNISTRLRESLNIWEKTDAPKSFAQTMFENYVFKQLLALENFKPFAINYKEATKFWEWWLTEAIPQTWK